MSGARAVRELLDGIVLDPPGYGWLGEWHEVRTDGADEHEGFRRALAQRLYADFYVTGGIAPGAPGASGRPPPPPRPPPGFPAANRGSGTRADGWEVLGRRGGSVVVRRDGLTVWADESQIRAAAGASWAQVLLPGESTARAPGFYTAFGDAGSGAESDDDPVDRFYWNVRPEGRAALIEAVTGSLNEARLPFRFKVLSDADVLRCDAGVLYTPGEDRSRVLHLLPQIVRTVAAHLRERTPALTRMLAAGLGFAEDPPGRESFGVDRCARLAAGLCTAHAAGARTTRERVSALTHHFGWDGLSLSRPHLNAGSDAAADPPALAS